MQDLIRGIKKLTAKEAPKSQSVMSALASGAAPLLRRAFMFLEDGDWGNADEYAERALDLEPENAEAYIVKLMIERKAHKKNDLSKQDTTLKYSTFYQKALRFADSAKPNVYE